MNKKIKIAQTLFKKSDSNTTDSAVDDFLESRRIEAKHENLNESIKKIL